MAAKYPIRETTYAKSKFTVYQQGAAGGASLTPFDFIAIQAPRGVADDVMRIWFGVEPGKESCGHCGPDFSVYEDTDAEFINGSTRTTSTIRADALPYILNGVWKPKRWRLADDDE